MMALPRWPVGLTHRGIRVQWATEDGSVLDLTGAIFSGKMTNRATGTTRTMVGRMQLTAGTTDTMDYAPDATDVATAGIFTVDFAAMFPDQSVDYTFVTTWEIVAGTPR